MNSPCHGCDKRHTACHDACEAYKEWVAPYLSAREEKENTSQAYDYFKGRIDRMKRRRYSGNRAKWGNGKEKADGND